MYQFRTDTFAVRNGKIIAQSFAAKIKIVRNTERTSCWGCGLLVKLPGTCRPDPFWKDSIACSTPTGTSVSVIMPINPAFNPRQPQDHLPSIARLHNVAEGKGGKREREHTVDTHHQRSVAMRGRKE